MDSASSGRHSTTTGVMHSGTTLTDAMRQHEAKSFPTPVARDYRSGKGPANANRNTPNLSTIATTWSTPQAHDAQGAPGEASQARGNFRASLAADVALYPTPTASSYGSSNNGDPGDGRGEYATKGKPSLDTMARGWATPLTSDSEATGRSPGRQGAQNLRVQVKDWTTEPLEPSEPTPAPAFQLGLFGDSGPPVQTTPKRGPDGSPSAVLNPLFVEALMNYPPGWVLYPTTTSTNASTSSAPSATDRSPSAAPSPIACSPAALSDWKARMRSELQRLTG